MEIAHRSPGCLDIGGDAIRELEPSQAAAVDRGVDALAAAIERRVRPMHPSPSSAPETDHPSIRRVLLATDLSPASGPATDAAFEVAHRHRAALLILSVIDTDSLRLPGGRFRARVDQVRERREARAQALVQRGRRAGVVVDFLVWEGDPGESIVEAARSEGADVILLGRHRRGPLGRRLFGSVSEYVTRRSAIPVVVIPG